MTLLQRLKGYWELLNRPSRHFALGFLTMGGFIAGIIFWGGFNTALEYTNTEEFCVSCHEMRNNVFEELSHTVHFSQVPSVPIPQYSSTMRHLHTKEPSLSSQSAKLVSQLSIDGGPHSLMLMQVR